MKKKLIAILFMLSCLTVLSTSIKAQDAKLGIDLDTTFVSKYMWRGYDIYDDHGAWQPSVNVDLFGSGFSVNVWGSLPIGSGNEDLTEIDFTAAYSFSGFQDEVYATDITLDYVYLDYPKLSHTSEAQEMEMWVSMPKLLSIGDIAIVPGYCIAFMWPTSSDVSDVAGTFHVFSLGFELPLPGTEQALSFGAELVYNDGAYGADNDWSDAAFSVSTRFEVGRLSITPSVNYQISMDDSVNSENELWTTLSFSTSF